MSSDSCFRNLSKGLRQNRKTSTKSKSIARDGASFTLVLIGTTTASGRVDVSGEIVCADLTTDDVGDPTTLPELLDQIDGPVQRFIADGAYDGSPTRNFQATCLGEIVEVIIPPPKTAVQSPQSAEDLSIRDRHIAEIETKGRMAWQKSSGYNQRSWVETQMGRMEDSDRAETHSKEFRQSEDRSKNRCPSSQSDD